MFGNNRSRPQNGSFRLAEGRTTFTFQQSAHISSFAVVDFVGDRQCSSVVERILRRCIDHGMTVGPYAGALDRLPVQGPDSWTLDSVRSLPKPSVESFAAFS
jgi:hypothetical protein